MARWRVWISHQLQTADISISVYDLVNDRDLTVGSVDVTTPNTFVVDAAPGVYRMVVSAMSGPVVGRKFIKTISALDDDVSVLGSMEVNVVEQAPLV